MTAQVSYDSVEVGTELPPKQFDVKRLNLVMYAGASGDFNVIHWNERFAKAVGLPNVIAHGMFTMASVGMAVTDWVGDPGAVVEYGVRFSRPVVVPDDDAGARCRLPAGSRSCSRGTVSRCCPGPPRSCSWSDDQSRDGSLAADTVDSPRRSLSPRRAGGRDVSQV